MIIDYKSVQYILVRQSMMRIGHFDYKIWAVGGIASYVRRVSTAQRSAGHETVFFSKYACQGNTPTETPSVVPDDASLYRAALRARINVLHVHGPITTLPPPELTVIRTLHGHTPYCPSGSQFLKLWGRPCGRTYSPLGCMAGHVFSYCGSIRPQKMIKNFRRTQAEMKVLPAVPVITVSHFLKDRMVDMGYPAGSIHVLHLFAPGVKTEAPPPQDATPHMVFLGRIVPQKGLLWLLRALALVKTPIHLDIAGTGYQQAEAERLAQQLNLGDRTTFHGWVSPERVNELIAAARGVVFPSLWHEPGGTVAFEAMAHSRPVIMSRVGGMPEVVRQEVNGLMVNPNDVEGLAAAIDRLAQDWALATRLGQQGRQLAVEQYSFDRHFESLMNLYKAPPGVCANHADISHV